MSLSPTGSPAVQPQAPIQRQKPEPTIHNPKYFGYKKGSKGPTTGALKNVRRTIVP